MIKMLVTLLFATVMIWVVAIPGHAAETLGTMALELCHIPDYSREVLCGSHWVYEDRKNKQGRQIDIQFAVLPAISQSKQPDPVVFFAGGPGQGARKMAAFAKKIFSKVNQSRDIVLIDQRGMGDSHLLACDAPEEDALTLSEPALNALVRENLRQCLTELDADVRLYTQDLANEDIHEILQALGYVKVNLYGASWGTRSALLYAHRFTDQVRSLIVDGSAPLENRLPLFFAEDSESALQALFRDCLADADCQKTFPNLAQDFTASMKLIGSQGIEVSLPDPITGEPQTFVLSRSDFTLQILRILYSPDLTRVLPLIIQQAKTGDYRALIGVYSLFVQSVDIASGAHHSIMCSEELARIDEQMFDQVGAKGFLGSALIDSVKNICRVWPTAPLPSIYGEKVGSQAPALILSGELDPVTPARWGEKMSEVLPNSLHLIAKATAHGVSVRACVDALMLQFIDQGGFQDLDGSCVQALKRPSFFVDGSGPSRGLARGPARVQDHD